MTKRIAYFGGEPLSVPVLEALHTAGITPDLIICNPDRPAGRGHKLTPPPTKIWAETHSVPVFQPERIKRDTDLSPITDAAWDLFVVVAYNHILPQWFLDIPKHGTLNTHPSLLPKLRGPSPIRTAILEDRPNEVGVSIMLMDAEMDHGPLIAQQAMPISDEMWPIRGSELDSALARLGGAMLADVIPRWLAGELTATEQDHTQATYTKKFSKDMGALVLDPQQMPRGEAARHLLRTIRALDGFPGTYFMHDGKRIKINEAELAPDGSLRLITITPEGKSPQPFEQYFSN